MSTYPASLDDLGASNPSSSTQMDDGAGHAAQHADANDAIDAIQVTLGTDPQGGSTDVATRLDDLAFADLADVDMSGIANGDVPVWNSGSSKFEPGSGGGGGGGGSTWPPDVAPLSPSAYDYEFDGSGTSVPSGWAWVNQGGAAYVEQHGSGYLTVPGNSVYSARAIVQAIDPASSWTLTAKFRVVVKRYQNYSHFGLLLRDAGSDKGFEWGFDGSAPGSRGLVWIKHTAPTTYSSEGTQYPVHIGDTIYLRIKKNSATSYDLGFSPDGAIFHDFVTGYDVGAFCTPTDFGFFGECDTSYTTQPLVVACDWFRVT